MGLVDPLHLCIALGPLAMYLLLLGIINLSSRPFLTSGSRDTVALGIAIVGFIAAGPMELFVPEAAAMRWGGYIWLLLLAFYGLCLTLLVLIKRPKIVIYNATTEQLRPIMADIVSQLDSEARWAGDGLSLPQLGVQLNVESSPGMRNIQLVSAGPRQSYAGWARLESALNQALRKSRTTANPYGFSLLLFGVSLIAVIAFMVVKDPQAVAQSLNEMLRR